MAAIADDSHGDNEHGVDNSPHQSPPKESNCEALKRTRSTSVYSLRESKIPKPSNGQRPKASDFEDLTKGSILAAISIYRCLISTTDPFPDHGMEVKLARQAWEVACEDLEVDHNLTPKICKLASA
jgi:Domain of unknown function (DUF6532)